MGRWRDGSGVRGASLGVLAVAFLSIGVLGWRLVGEARPWSQDGSQVAAEFSTVLRLNGAEIVQQRYLEHLYTRFGPTERVGFLHDLLIQERANALGVELDPEVLDERVEDEVQRGVDTFGGDREAFVASLGERHMTLYDFRGWKRQALRPRLLLEACIRRDRVVTPAEVRRRFEEVYGPGGERRQIRHLLISAGEDREDARAEARRLLQTLESDPGRFVDLVKEHSDDDLSKGNDGLLPGYRPGIFGEDFDAAVAEFDTPGQVAGPVESRWGVHLIQLSKVSVTPFADVEKELRESLEQGRPTVAERSEYLAGLVGKARVEWIDSSP